MPRLARRGENREPYPAGAAPDKEREGSAMSNPETTENIPGEWGLLAKYDDPIIRFLIDRKFPWLKRLKGISDAPKRSAKRGYAAPPAMPRSGAGITTISDGKLTPEGAAQVQRYEAELGSLSPEQRRRCSTVRPRRSPATFPSSNPRSSSW